MSSPCGSVTILTMFGAAAVEVAVLTKNCWQSMMKYHCWFVYWPHWWIIRQVMPLFFQICHHLVFMSATVGRGHSFTFMSLEKGSDIDVFSRLMRRGWEIWICSAFKRGLVWHLISSLNCLMEGDTLLRGAQWKNEMLGTKVAWKES